MNQSQKLNIHFSASMTQIKQTLFGSKSFPSQLSAYKYPSTVSEPVLQLSEPDQTGLAFVHVRKKSALYVGEDISATGNECTIVP
jgi:hypothetical protein